MGNPSNHPDVADSGLSAAEERDHAGDVRDHAAEQRDIGAEQRDVDAERRDRAADVRDQVSDRRDHAADLRDQAADLRDDAAAEAERAVDDDVDRQTCSASALARQAASADRNGAMRDRRAGADERTEAEHDRETALADRRAAAAERTQAEHDRETALADRQLAAKDRGQASHDDLTGSYLRGAGFAELRRDIARARRAGQPFVVAFVDVNHLKAINDLYGHAAGDHMLVQVARALAAHMRSYDLIIRYGGDEFICALPGLNSAGAAQRLGRVNAHLAKGAVPGSVTFGLAELRPRDSAEDVVARADAALYRHREEKGHTTH